MELVVTVPAAMILLIECSLIDFYPREEAIRIMQMLVRILINVSSSIGYNIHISFLVEPPWVHHALSRENAGNIPSGPANTVSCFESVFGGLSISGGMVAG